MTKTIDPKQSKEIQEEISNRVFERYQEIQGKQAQESELSAALESLHDITSVPLSEIEKIAQEVIQAHNGDASPVVDSDSPAKIKPNVELFFRKTQKKITRKKRFFIIHLTTYSCIQIPLIYLNFISTSFPWVMFPLLGWGIGLASHYFAAYRWPQKDLEHKIDLLKNQTHLILDENIALYCTEAKTRIFNGVYRLLVSECSNELMIEYLNSLDPSLKEGMSRQVATQLISIRRRVAK